MRIAITGSTGLVGTALVSALQAAGHQPVRLVRNPSDTPSGKIAHWQPDSGAIDLAALGEIDAVIHLAGENVAAGRWTAARKQRIEQSRGPATEKLCRTLAGLPTPPKVIISASATGIYGDRDDEELDEDSPVDATDSFLARVAREWELATQPLNEIGARVVHLRIGVVLAPNGGALSRMLLPFRMGLGGRLGSGDHWMSWITLHDLVRSLQHILAEASLRGPVLAVSPTPISNRDFTRALGKALHRPTIFPVPSFALRTLFGELATILLSSQRARPSRLLKSGFTFDHSDIDSGLAAMKLR